MPQIELENRLIEAKINPDPGFDLYFNKMVGQEELGRPFLYEVDLISPKTAKPALLSMLGSKMTISVKLATAGKFRYFNGIITQARYMGQSGQYERYRFQLRPQLWLLSHEVTSRIFQNKKLIDVIVQVLKDAGITDISDSTMNASALALQEFCVQFNESTFDFVSRLMEEAGIYYFHSHTAAGHKLVLADDPNCHTTLSGSANVEFFDSDNDYRRNEDHIFDWTTTATFTPAAFEQRDFNFETSVVDLTTRSRMPPSHSFNSYEVFDYPGQYGTAPDGTKLAGIRMQELAAAREVAKGQCNVRAMNTGGTFTLKSFPDEAQNRQYLCTSATYRLTNAEDEREAGDTSFQVADTFLVDFEVIPATVMFRPRRITPRPIIAGPQTAMVVGPAGQEIYTDKFGRVKVRFFWDRSTSQDADASCWIRVSQAWAGVSWGGMAIPRIKQEVIVEFLDGNPDRPIITGRVYNDISTVPYALPAEQTKSTLKTNSTPGGGGFNEIRLEDKKGEEEFYVHAQKDMKVEVLNDKTSTITNNRTTTVSKGNDSLKVDTGNRSVEIAKGNETTKVSLGNQEITVSAGNQTTNVTAGKSSLTAGQEISLTVGGANIKIEPAAITLSMGPSSVKLDASGVSVNGVQIKLAASAMLDANGGPMTSIAGGIVKIN